MPKSVPFADSKASDHSHSSQKLSYDDVFADIRLDFDKWNHRALYVLDFFGSDSDP